MFSKITKILMLSASLLVAGTASAADRNVIVPVLAGAAVGAVAATLIARNDRDDDRHRYYRKPPREYREYRHYRRHHPPVQYVPVRPYYEQRHYAPPPPHYYRHDRYDRHRW
ncbi:hypothetical protein NRB16_13960 [Pseudomonas sp. LJDD11]|uniref:hypothetical protein n=1 Tax=unclassified Pseudomonas TaxID=196821 RepID=UPI0004F5B18C|nr:MULTISPECIES: hypothetical protein [unclassified Pseudomonas]MCO8162860.1 hypothetical protein [Pseudomonas sp. 21LCFQ010]MCQ9424624.1 hypothetical protein [Pseudomonas sp. LJDD11]BAP43313.1 putative uncharacterized protein [Pseudomonas sp. StFLB209]